MYGKKIRENKDKNRRNIINKLYLLDKQQTIKRTQINNNNLGYGRYFCIH